MIRVGRLAGLVLVTMIQATSAGAGTGWYLMQPPLLDEEPNKSIARLHIGAPLSQWSLYRAYDSAERCEEVRSAWQKGAGEMARDVDRLAKSGEVERGNGFLKGPSSLLRQGPYVFALCVASDDPRLK